MVVKVDKNEITTKEMKTGEESKIPYGMALWSTGIGTRPFVKDFMNQIGQVRPSKSLTSHRCIVFIKFTRVMINEEPETG